MSDVLGGVFGVKIIRIHGCFMLKAWVIPQIFQIKILFPVKSISKQQMIKKVNGGPLIKTTF